MRILFDENTPAPLRYRLLGHDVDTTQEMGWGRLENGDLLAAAEAEGFDLFLTATRTFRIQQNLEGRKLAIEVLAATSSGRTPARLWKLLTAQRPELMRSCRLLCCHAGHLDAGTLTQKKK